MSTPHARPSEAPVGASPVHAEVGAFFRRVHESGPQPRMRALSGICQFNIDGAGIWQATVKKGVVSVVEGAVADPASVTCTITCDAIDFLRLVHREGNLNVFAAALQELFTISGDLPFAWGVLGGFIMNPVDMPLR